MTLNCHHLQMFIRTGASQSHTTQTLSYLMYTETRTMQLPAHTEEHDSTFCRAQIGLHLTVTHSGRLLLLLTTEFAVICTSQWLAMPPGQLQCL